MPANPDPAPPPTRPTGGAGERALMRAARAGDSDAFGRLVEPYRRELHVHCYRMLGSFTDAEDALQEALVRAWRGFARFEGRSSLRSWLYRIATNACLRALERRPQRILPDGYGPPADAQDGLADPVTEHVWLEPYPDAQLDPDVSAVPDARYEQREGVELAFVAALQHLPARQRAVLILRDVLGYSTRETATVLDTTPVSVDSALQRAHRTVAERLPGRTQQQTLRLVGDDELSRLVERFVTAWEQQDVDAVVALLTEDARLVMPPLPTWFLGREEVAASLRAYGLAGDEQWRLLPTSANGQPALAAYTWDVDAAAFTPHCLNVLTLREGRIAEITAFLAPGSFAPYGMPPSVAA